MKDTHAYTNCCAWYTCCSQEDIRKFASILGPIGNVQHAFKDKMIVHDYKLLKRILAESTANEIEEKEPTQ